VAIYLLLYIVLYVYALYIHMYYWWWVRVNDAASWWNVPTTTATPWYARRYGNYATPSPIYESTTTTNAWDGDGYAPPYGYDATWRRRDGYAPTIRWYARGYASPPLLE
jgi:hypothetical protein